MTKKRPAAADTARDAEAARVDTTDLTRKDAP